MRARERGVGATAEEGLRHLTERDGDEQLRGFWLHFDADVLSDAVMEAVDYRLPGGLTPDEASDILRRARQTGRLIGVTVTIYNPHLDPSGDAARTLTACLLAGLRGG